MLPRASAQYDRWTGRTIPTYHEGEHFTPLVKFDEGRTSAPSPLTEAELIGLMDAEMIGTDATISEHIKKVIERESIGPCDEV